MADAGIKEDMTLEDYAKTVMKCSKTFKGIWDNALLRATVSPCVSLSGEQALVLLAKHFMNTGCFLTISSRIEDWASLLLKASEDHPGIKLKSICQGRAPDWWIHYQNNGFVQVQVQGQVFRTKAHEQILKEQDQVNTAYTVRSALAITVELVDQFIATDHHEAKMDERERDHRTWVPPRNRALPCFRAAREPCSCL
jgi:hypothetical protein